MKKISIVTACFNEEENVEEVYSQVKKVMTEKLPNYTYEHIFIDNASEDKTVEILKRLAKEDKNLKIIVNSRNFGWNRSPTHALFEADGDAVISLVADLQDPPELIYDLVKKWESGNEIVLAIKKSSKENHMMYKIREMYYRVLTSLSEVKIYKNFTAFGLYGRKAMDAMKTMKDPYPFWRGMVSEVGFDVGIIEYDQPVRYRGIKKSNFYSLYDMGMLGIISNSKIPLRIAIFASVVIGCLSLFIGIFYFILKIVFWDEMSVGIAPLIILFSFISSILLFFIGIIGEYIGAIYTQVLNRPLVFEKKRINFDK